MAADIIDKSKKFSEQLENIIRIFKHGKKEQALFSIGFLCLAAANLPVLLKGVVGDTVMGGLPRVLPYLNFISIIPFIWGIILVWKKALPSRAMATETIKPSAIKGPFAFNEMDGLIFSRLGRQADISKLLSWAVDSQISFVALKGESGAGKTSLLRAGLVYTLSTEKEKYGLTPIYWEAKADNAVDELLRTVHLACPEEKDDIESLDDLLTQKGRCAKVIIIDQAEQLSPDRHPEIFELFKKIVSQKPPYRTRWIIAFREEYASTWFDFECSVPDFHPPKQSLKIFSSEQAQDIMAILAAESHLSPDAAVLTDMIQAMSEDGRVSPVEIGIGMMVLSELYSMPGGEISLGSFRDAGGVTGLLRTYIKNKFEDGIPSHEHAAVEKALLGLIDPQRPHQRIATGKSVVEAAALAELPTARMQQNLDYLALQSVRLVEKLHSGTYRLAHERLIPALESLTREMLAAAEQAKRLLHERFLMWQRAKLGKFLLSGRELRQVLIFRPQFQQNITVDQRRFLDKSKQRRNWFRFAVVSAVLLALLSPIVYETLFETMPRNVRIKQLRDQFVPIGGGTFAMGDSSASSSPDEQPVHMVTLTDFCMSPYEITNQQYCDFLNAAHPPQDSVDVWIDLGDSQVKRVGRNYVVSEEFTKHPVVYVSWYGAVAFAQWLERKFEGCIRLPTEAEWEYACRAGTTSQFNTGDSLAADQENYGYTNGTETVGSYAENDFGLYDTHGNVVEWCSDWYDGVYYYECYKRGVAMDPTGPETGSTRVIRGGSWYFSARGCRSALRYDLDPEYRDYYVGFRLVFVPQSVGSL